MHLFNSGRFLCAIFFLLNKVVEAILGKIIAVSYRLHFFRTHLHFFRTHSREFFLCFHIKIVLDTCGARILSTIGRFWVL